MPSASSSRLRRQLSTVSSSSGEGRDALVSYLRGRLRTGEGADATLILKDELDGSELARLKVHSMVLGRSPFFEALFGGPFMESNNRCADLRIDKSLLLVFTQCLLPLFYTGEVESGLELSLQEVLGFFLLLDFYHVQDGYQIAREMLSQRMNEDNVVEVLDFVISHRNLHCFRSSPDLMERLVVRMNLSNLSSFVAFVFAEALAGEQPPQPILQCVAQAVGSTPAARVVFLQAALDSGNLEGILSHRDFSLGRFVSVYCMPRLGENLVECLMALEKFRVHQQLSQSDNSRSRIRSSDSACNQLRNALLEEAHDRHVWRNVWNPHVGQVENQRVPFNLKCIMQELSFGEGNTSTESAQEDYRQHPTMNKLQLRYAKLSLCQYLHNEILKAYHADTVMWRSIVMQPKNGMRKRAEGLDTTISPTVSLEAANYLQEAQMRLLQEVSELGSLLNVNVCIPGSAPSTSTSSSATALN